MPFGVPPLVPTLYSGGQFGYVTAKARCRVTRSGGSLQGTSARIAIRRLRNLKA